jgi:hypothetical protein
MKTCKRLLAIFLKLILVLLFAGITGCSSGSSVTTPDTSDQDGSPIRFAAASQYVVLAWNDLGMHCLNPTYDVAALLPPYNTVWAQVIRRGNKPQVVTSGVTVEYRILNNTYTYGKRSYGQFWDYLYRMAGITLPRNKGLNLDDPLVHNGLSGTMLSKGDHFQASGIPVCPVNDSNVWNPYQVVEVTAKVNGAVVATTTNTIPTSDEISCSRCHTSNAFVNILQTHDRLEGTTLDSKRPIVCAKCHGSPALGQTKPGKSGKWLSQAIHGFHSTKGAACYDCHPGSMTRCSRSLAHTAVDGKCKTCHGTMADVANSVTNGTRTPWLTEPKCVTCHTGGIPQVDTGSTLYRFSKGHGNLYCSACHGSPHAMVPAQQSSDNAQTIRYQGKAKTLGVCSACHTNSKGPESTLEMGDFLEEHVNGGRLTACHVCHTGFTNVSSTSPWPHSYKWKSRP